MPRRRGGSTAKPRISAAASAPSRCTSTTAKRSTLPSHASHSPAALASELRCVPTLRASATQPLRNHGHVICAKPSSVCSSGFSSQRAGPSKNGGCGVSSSVMSLWRSRREAWAGIGAALHARAERFLDKFCSLPPSLKPHVVLLEPRDVALDELRQMPQQENDLPMYLVGFDVRGGVLEAVA